MKRFLLKLLIIFVFVFCVIANVSANSEDFSINWPQFRGMTLVPGITDSKTPRTAEETEEKWVKYIGERQESDGYEWIVPPGTPVAVGNYIYATGQGNINRLSKDTGEILQSAKIEGTTGFFSYITYGDGKLFVPCTSNGNLVIIAYDEQTLEQLWITEDIGNSEDYLQPVNPILYYNGYIYMGASDGQGAKGMYICFSTEENPAGKKSPAWTYKPASGNSGFYWSNGAVVGNNVIIGGENGQISSFGLTGGNMTDSITVEGAIRSAIHYDNQTKRIFAATKAGYIFSVKVNADGSFDKNSLKSKLLGSEITSSPVVYNGRLYISGGSVFSETGFTVMDAETLETAYIIDDVKTQSSPIISTAYATEDNGGEVYIYAVNFSGEGNDASCLYAIKDKPGQKSASYEIIAVPSVGEYCSQSVTVDETGAIYFFNDSGNVFAFGHTKSENGIYTYEDVINGINRLPSTETVTLLDKPQISLVRARYNNLPENQKNDVTNLNKLEVLEKLMDEPIVIAELITKIDMVDLDELTLEDADFINELQLIYNQLSEDGKSRIVNYDKLSRALDVIKALQDEEIHSSALPSQPESVVNPNTGDSGILPLILLVFCPLPGFSSILIRKIHRNEK